MRDVISACTHKAFSHGPMPLAHLKPRRPDAVNDNNTLFSVPRGRPTFHSRRAAYGRVRFIVALLALACWNRRIAFASGVLRSSHNG